jgi:hypothetical protein
MCSSSLAAINEPWALMALSSRHLPSPNTPSMFFVLSQSLNLGFKFFTSLASLLLRETSELTFADFYLVPITNTPDFNNLNAEFSSQLKGIGTRQSFLATLLPGLFENSID